jgi:hypothetical protein
MYKIEKDIPVPTRISNGGFPFMEMQVGDSFLVPEGTTSNASMFVMISKAGKEMKAKFTSKKVEGGRRIWRIK